MNGERALIAAVILQAVTDLNDKKDKKLRAEAYDWFESTAHAEGSFEWCCGLLDYEAEYWRNKILIAPRGILSELKRLAKYNLKGE